MGIEIDGDSHFQDGARARDELRDAFIKSQGITILRYTNLDVKLTLQGVVDDLLAFIEKHQVPPPAPPK